VAILNSNPKATANFSMALGKRTVSNDQKKSEPPCKYPFFYSRNLLGFVSHSPKGGVQILLVFIKRIGNKTKISALFSSNLN